MALGMRLIIQMTGQTQRFVYLTCSTRPPGVRVYTLGRRPVIC